MLARTQMDLEKVVEINFFFLAFKGTFNCQFDLCHEYRYFKSF